jgi:hypothetical protein
MALNETGCGLDLLGLGYAPVAGFCEHGEKSPDSIKGGKLLD